ncbi:MAG: HEAT repeat domain-containing protein [Myxococcota bacterium]
MSKDRRYYILRSSLYGLVGVVAAGVVIGSISQSLQAADGGIPSGASNDQDELAFPNWKPMFDEPSGNAPADPSQDGEATEEVIQLAPAETLDEAIRVASYKEGEERQQAFANLWRRYSKSVILELLTTRIERRSLEEATVAAAIFSVDERVGIPHLLELMNASDERLADRTTFALAKIGRSAVPIFGTLLQTSSGKTQYRATWGLGQSGGSEAARMLATQARHPEVRMRTIVLDALAATAPADRQGLLLAFADDPHPGLRRRMAELYAVEPDEAAIPALQKLARESLPDVRVAAVVALAAQPGADKLLEEHLSDPLEAIRAEAARSLALLAKPSRARELLRQRDPVVRLAAFDGIEARQDLDVSIYTALLEAPEVELRQRALARVLDQDGTAQVETVAAFLADADGDVQLKALGWLQAKQVLKPSMLVPLSETGVRRAQGLAIDQLLSWNTADALDVLGYFAYVPDLAQRQRVVARLGQDPNKLPFATLARLATDADVKVRRTALAALIARPEDESARLMIKFLADAESTLRRDAANALGMRRDSRAAIALGQRSMDSSKEVREASVRALKLISDDLAAGALVAYLDDNDPALREQALRSLINIRTPVSLGFVGEVAHKSNVELRALAIDLLQAEGRREGKELGTKALAAAQLTQFFQDPNPTLQLAAIDATGRVAHGEAVAALAKLSDRSNPEVRLVAVDALRRVRDNRAVEALEIYRHDEAVAVRQGAYKGLAQVGGSKGYAKLIEGLKDDNESVRTTVIESLGELELGMSVPALTDRLQTASFGEQKAIIAALGKIRTSDARAVLIDLAASKGLFNALLAQQALDNPRTFNAAEYKRQIRQEQQEQSKQKKSRP